MHLPLSRQLKLLFRMNFNMTVVLVKKKIKALSLTQDIFILNHNLTIFDKMKHSTFWLLWVYSENDLKDFIQIPTMPYKLKLFIFHNDTRIWNNEINTSRCILIWLSLDVSHWISKSHKKNYACKAVFDVLNNHVSQQSKHYLLEHLRRLNATFIRCIKTAHLLLLYSFLKELVYFSKSRSIFRLSTPTLHNQIKYFFGACSWSSWLWRG